MIARKLEQTVIGLIQSGVQYFGAGGALGFDTLAALKVLDLAGINLEYLYAFCARTVKHAYLVIRVADNQKAEEVLTAAGFHMIEDADVAKL